MRDTNRTATFHTIGIARRGDRPLRPIGERLRVFCLYGHVPVPWSACIVVLIAGARPSISVVIPAYNAAAHIGEALQSVSRQTLAPLEVVVVDDASTDATVRVATALGAHVVRAPRNAGPSAARNAGVAAASGTWIAFLDADDIWADEKLETQWETIRRWPSAGFSFTDYDMVRVDGSVLSAVNASTASYRHLETTERHGTAVSFATDSFIDGLVRSMFIRQSSVIVNRELFAKSGGYDESVSLGEDYDLFLRMISLGPAVGVERSLVTYRRRPASLSADPIAEIASIDALWEQILKRPERYPQRAVRAVEARRVATLLKGVRLALRLGRFADAGPFARKALERETSPATVLFAAVVPLVGSLPGRFMHRYLRELWKRRRSLGPRGIA